eukprot:5885346-Amphidinium_carterae.2
MPSHNHEHCMSKSRPNGLKLPLEGTCWLQHVSATWQEDPGEILVAIQLLNCIPRVGSLRRAQAALKFIQHSVNPLVGDNVWTFRSVEMLKLIRSHLAFYAKGVEGSWSTCSCYQSSLQRHGPRCLPPATANWNANPQAPYFTQETLSHQSVDKERVTSAEMAIGTETIVL